MREKSFYLISLGCAKNTVDSASIGQLLLNDGYAQVEKPTQAELLIVNTCGFILPAREEAIQVLQELAQGKKRGQILVAAGCLTERYSDYVVKNVPKIDGVIGTKRWMDLLDLIQQIRAKKSKSPLYHLPNSDTVGSDEHGVYRFALQGASAYLKIADGCHRPCAFCSIPLIKGTTVSRPMDKILEEARWLQDNGTKEIILIAQDSTAYGLDLGIKDGLPNLLEQLVKTVPEIPWIRVLYAFPGFVTDRLIEVMANNPQILHYLDIPLQHAHPEVLKRMHRPSNMEWVYQTIDKMRKAIPDLTIRTTFIVGYPGETEEEFQTLLDFIKEIKFNHIGVFPFFFEPGTTSEPLGDPISQEVKQERVERLMLLQEEISQDLNRKSIGGKLDVLIEGIDEKGISIGRSYRDAPEIDGLVIAEGRAKIGSIVSVKITSALPHDLIGHIIK
jgi:ribosomal protein S12 methylthiotransferase